MCLSVCVPSRQGGGKDSTEGEMLSQQDPMSMSVGPPEEGEGGGMNITDEGEQDEEPDKSNSAQPYLKQDHVTLGR